MQKRAKTGGEVGTNGEFYHGGEFLPTTELPSRHKGKVTPKARKQEWEPYKWSFAPIEGQFAIFPQLSGALGKYDHITKTFTVFAPYVSQLPIDAQERAAELVRRYNAGERWI
jgi:hypothetical protein